MTVGFCWSRLNHTDLPLLVEFFKKFSWVGKWDTSEDAKRVGWHHVKATFLSSLKGHGDQRKSWWLEENNHTHLQKRDKSKIRNCRAVRLISVPGKITEQVFQEALAMHMKEKEVVWKSQQKYTIVLDQPDCLLQWNSLPGRHGTSCGCHLPWFLARHLTQSPTISFLTSW